MQKVTLTLALAAGLALGARAADLDGSDWSFAYQGHYSVAAADLSGLGLDPALSATVGAQLALLNGGVSANQGATLAQTSGAALTTSALDFTPSGSNLLLPTVRGFLYELLNAGDGAYAGVLSGSTLTLSKAPLVGAAVVAPSVIDTRVAGVGTVVDLMAVVPTSVLAGSIDGLRSGAPLAYGPQAVHVAGTAGLMGTIGLQARATNYSLGLGGIVSSTTGYVGVGAIRTTADSWSLSRAPQAVPEPSALAALGLGALGALRRRRRKA